MHHKTDQISRLLHPFSQQKQSYTNSIPNIKQDTIEKMGHRIQDMTGVSIKKKETTNVQRTSEHLQQKLNIFQDLL